MPAAPRRELSARGVDVLLVLPQQGWAGSSRLAAWQIGGSQLKSIAVPSQSRELGAELIVFQAAAAEAELYGNFSTTFPFFSLLGELSAIT